MRASEANRDRTEDHLRRALRDPAATFQPGQWEAVRALVEERAQMLVVQRTGWGKSMVYFLSTRMLRDRGAGSTLLISPLLSLMRNQIEAAERIGITAHTLNSDNRSDWAMVEHELERDAVDILLISPERLDNERFRQGVLPKISDTVGMLVVDEAHCISDWGHDFRPDYRRIVRLLRSLPPNVPVLATTATASSRVIEDVVEQLGKDLVVSRGPLARASLLLQTVSLPSREQRMAWLAHHLPAMEGSGIVYVRTVRDAEQVAAWLRSTGIEAQAYFGGAREREVLERRLLDNEIKALVATSALGMGFDKPDLRFVVHYQRPGSVVEYYQQVGRAGRDGKTAYGVLLGGAEDDAITDYFIYSAFPPAQHIEAVLGALDEADDGLSFNDVLQRVNLTKGQVDKVLKILAVEVPAPFVRQDGKLYATANPYTPDEDKIERLIRIRRREQAEIRRYMAGDDCLMAFLRRSLDDEDVRPCGVCAVCQGRPILPETVPEDLRSRASRFLKQDHPPIPQRKQLPEGKPIESGLRAEEGRALCSYGDAGWGPLVKRGKYEDDRFADELVGATSRMLRESWRPEPPPSWVTCVPSLRRPELVPSFARRLADALELPFVGCVRKTGETLEQKDQSNSFHQLNNVRGAYKVEIPPEHAGENVLLVDDVVYSGWTLAYVAACLRNRGAGRVYPLALAKATGG